MVLASRKGGAGKTTFAGHLAYAASSGGYGPVAVVDMDPQGSLTSWWNERAAEDILYVSLETGLKAALDQCRTVGIKLLVVDTPPQTTTTISQTIEVADLVVVPVQPSPHDLRAVGGTAEIAKRANKPLVFVVNGAAHRARITTDAAIALSEHGAVAPTIIHQRTDFRTSMIDGRTVAELDPNSRSAAEITALWSYLANRLQMKNTHASEHAPA
jgi:chromosome partitioning protein